MNTFNIEKIHDSIWVFKNAVKDSQEVLEYLRDTKTWNDWYTFGTMANGTENGYSFNNFPTQSEWDNKINEFYPNTIQKGDPLYFEKTIDNLFYETTKLYLTENNIELSNWMYLPWNVAKYYANSQHPYIMHHHTDFQRELSYAPGIKFAITAVVYLNDNYEGGEVDFRFVDNDINITKEDYTYKPGAGDIVVFLSGHPHYHGVRSVTSGEKYIIRTYWRYAQDAHPKWLELKEKYGESWSSMEEERVRFTHKNHTIINNIPKFIDFEEYYNKLENGEL
jgi:hypothetical protein